MLNTYIVEVIDTFQPDEMEAFEFFLDSPYFNRGSNAEKLKKLFSLIVDAKQNPDLLTKDAVYKNIFQNKSVVDGKLDKLISELKKYLQIFLEVQRYRSIEREDQRTLDLLAELRTRGLEERYFQTLDKIKRKIANRKEETLENHQLQHKIAIEEYDWASTYNKVKGDLSIPAVITQLDKNYFIERTIMLTTLKLQQKVIIIPQSIDHADAWIIPEDQIKQSLLLQISWKIHALLSIKTPSSEQFQDLLQLLQYNEDKIGRQHLVEFYTHLRNFCTILIDNGHYEFRVVLHQIQRDNLERGYFYFDGLIPSSAFLNITQVALMVGEQQWAIAFVEQHKTRIIGDNETHDFYLMNKALCLFDEKKYEAALEIIPFGSLNSYYHLMARRLELKIYYELNSDLLPYKIDAFKMFVSRAGNKVLSENLHELFVNFINFLRQLSLSPKIKDKARSQQMIKRINEKKLVAERAWLLEKARELGERKK